MNLLTTKQASELLNVPAATLAQWRFAGKGPQYVKFAGRHVRYQREVLEAYVAANTHSHTSEYGQTALAA